ncbi:MAG: 4Fe-4S double cluster binding domain-containing protein [Desulfomonilaceae bacterium]
MASFPNWLTRCMEKHDVVLWNAADLRGISTPKDDAGKGFPFALACAVPVKPQIMASIRNGPNQNYCDEYGRLNEVINQLAGTLAAEMTARGFRAQPLLASERTDSVNIKGDFPHKTAATRAGLGWIGRHCQLVTRQFGPWVRLGTVFTDMVLPTGKPLERSYCGRCKRCVDACPANALKGKTWYPGLPREEILDVRACDQWKKENYFQYRNGHVCGICSSVCPYGLKSVKSAEKRLQYSE